MSVPRHRLDATAPRLLQSRLAGSVTHGLTAARVFGQQKARISELFLDPISNQGGKVQSLEETDDHAGLVDGNISTCACEYRQADNLYPQNPPPTAPR